MNKKILLAVLILVCSAAAHALAAGPYLVCDPQAGVTHYKLTGPAWTQLSVLAEANGSIRMDVSLAAVGVTNLTVKACAHDATWGEVCSAAVPFEFIRPGAPTIPANIRLQP